MKRASLFVAFAVFLMTGCADQDPVGVNSGTEPSGSVINGGPPAPKLVPFRASWTTSPGAPAAIECSISPPEWEPGLGNGVGEATHLGPSTIVFITASEPGGAGVERASTGCGVITADNGDLLFVEFRGTFTVGPFPFITGSGTTEFVGGTGRFSTATGSGTYEFINDAIARTGQLTQVGTISKPGPRRPGQSGPPASVE